MTGSMPRSVNPPMSPQTHLKRSNLRTGTESDMGLVKYTSKEYVHIGSISDIHIGHHRTTSEHIIDNLKKYLLNDKRFPSLDILFIPGDTFDRDLNLSDKYLTEIHHFIIKLLRACIKHDIVLRVLEGTPMHDRKQSRLFVTLNELLIEQADVKFIDDVHIEHIDKYNIDVLYVPDVISPTVEETQEKVKCKLKEHNLKKVDYALMHGFFPHNRPSNIPLPAHDPDYYLSIVRKYIFIGHPHTMNVHKRFITHGSFDRVRHDDLGDKGYFLVKSYPTSTEHDTITFVVNKDAKQYDSIKSMKMTKEKLITRLEKSVQRCSYITLHLERNSANESICLQYSRYHTDIDWNLKRKIPRTCT